MVVSLEEHLIFEMSGALVMVSKKLSEIQSRSGRTNNRIRSPR
jgi:hypothetical protein